MIPSKLLSYGFNGRDGTRITVSVTEDGNTCIWFPGELMPCLVSKEHPIAIDVRGNGPGPDVAVMVEASVATY